MEHNEQQRDISREILRMQDERNHSVMNVIRHWVHFSECTYRKKKSVAPGWWIRTRGIRGVGHREDGVEEGGEGVGGGEEEVRGEPKHDGLAAPVRRRGGGGPLGMGRGQPGKGGDFP